MSRNNEVDDILNTVMIESCEKRVGANKIQKLKQLLYKSKKRLHTAIHAIN